MKPRVPWPLHPARARLLGAVVAGGVLAGAAHAATLAQLTLTQLGGTVETQSGRVWTQASLTQPALSQPLRTGTGRATLRLAPGGTLTVGSSSQLRVYSGQPDVQAGRFFVQGTAGLYAAGHHLYAAGESRLDLGLSAQRVAVLSGTVRVSLGARSVTVRAGQQYDLRSGQVSPFAERDAWYRSQFVGEGEAVLQASRGAVQLGPDAAHLRPASLGSVLASGARLLTGPSAWAEVGFSGGGYLRLQADSELRVLGVEKTSAGREVLLQLQRGSAWNVVQKGQGGYQLSTPTVTTAVRGTVFRVDAAGLVKVFGGTVALPSQGDALVGRGRQRVAAGDIGVLKKDALDTLNLSLDALRAQPTVLEVPRPAQDGRLTLRVNPGAQVTAQLGSPAGSQVLGVSGQDGTYTVQVAPQQAAPLAEGLGTLTVRAQRPNGSVSVSQAIIIDRTPPTLTVDSVQVDGATFTVRGRVTDNLSPQMSLQAVLNAQTYILHASGAFVWTLPLGVPAGQLTTGLHLSATDDAGNRGDARLP